MQNSQERQYSVGESIDFSGSLALPLRRGIAAAGRYAYMGEDLRPVASSMSFTQVRLMVQANIQTGGVGTVYRVTLGRSTYALKFVPCMVTGGAHEDLFQRILREVQVGRVAHPNLLAIYGVGAVPGGIGILMEFVDGSDLFTLRNDSWVLSDIALVGWQVADALAALHAPDIAIIHRDVKPDNIFVVSRGGMAKHAILGDFGVAHLTNAPALTQQGMKVGTPNYMAPEQLHAQGRPTGAIDVWALAIVLYRLHFQAHPFLDSEELSNLEALGAMHHIFSEMRPPGIALDHTDPFQDLLARCLSYAPEQRPKAHEMARELQRIYQQEFALGIRSGTRRSKAPPVASACLPETNLVDLVATPPSIPGAASVAPVIALPVLSHSKPPSKVLIVVAAVLMVAASVSTWIRVLDLLRSL